MEASTEILSHWMMETARSAVLSGRGHGDAATRAAERARLLAARCAKESISLVPRLASVHAEFIGDCAGTQEETGTIGWFFLQRLGMFVDAHVGRLIPVDEVARLQALGEPDQIEVNRTLAEQGLPATPPPEWPQAPDAKAPGRTRARIGILGDPHCGMDFSDRIIPAAIADMNKENLDFSFAIGDITQDGTQSSFERAGEILKGFDHQLLLTLGNHDMWGGGEEPAGRERFNATFKADPFGIAEANGVRLIGINSAIAEASPYPPFSFTAGAFTDEPNESVPGGALDDEVSTWMETVEPDGPTFIALHHPPWPYVGLPPLVFGLDEQSTERLAKFAKRLKAEAIICGHTHRSAIYELDGTTVIEIPSTKEWPFGYGVIEVTDEGWSFNLRRVSDDALVEEGNRDTNIIIRRYARGPTESRALTRTF